MDVMSIVKAEQEATNDQTLREVTQTNTTPAVTPNRTLHGAIPPTDTSTDSPHLPVSDFAGQKTPPTPVQEAVHEPLCEATRVSAEKAQTTSKSNTLCKVTQDELPEQMNLDTYDGTTETDSADNAGLNELIIPQPKTHQMDSSKLGVYYEVLTASGDNINYIHHDDILQNQPTISLKKLDIQQVQAAAEATSTSEDEESDNKASTASSSDHVQKKIKRKFLQPRK